MDVLSRVIDMEDMYQILDEFSRLKGKTYLDNAGAAMYPRSLIHSIKTDLSKNIYLNPHSDKYTKDCIDQIRYKILRYFHTNSDEYTVIFTSGSTEALKKVVESFHFNNKGNDCKYNSGAFVYLSENHTSVIGMREIARHKNSNIIPVSHDEFLNIKDLKICKVPEADENALFVYSAQSNFNGFKYDLCAIKSIKRGSLNNLVGNVTGKGYKNWYVMLDAACYASTNPVNLSEYKPDFMCISFYKIFGTPTGLGALLVKNEISHVMNNKIYFGGGTVDVVLASEDYHVKRKNLSECFEDGTNSFLSILSLNQCFSTMERLFPKYSYHDIMKTVSLHTYYLAQDMYTQMCNLKHHNGTPAVEIYADSDYTDVTLQGGLVTFNLMRSDGTYIGYSEFQHMANVFSIYIRTGCFCNSGSCQRHLRLSSADVKAALKAGHVCGDEMDLFQGKPTGCVRVSFGYYNTYKDVDALIEMILKCFVEAEIRKPVRTPIADEYHKNIDKNENTSRQKEKNCQNDTKQEAETCEEISKKCDVNNVINNTRNTESAEKNHQTSKTVSDKKAEKGVLVDMAIFPVKSCGAYNPKESWNIGPKGFEYDREWMIVTENGTCLTQKQTTRMCMIRPDFDLEKKQLILNFPGMPSISLPLEIKSSRWNIEALLCQSKVCNDIIQGHDCGDEVADWISQALEISFLRLIRQSDNNQRLQKSEETLLSFSNTAQYLLINKATVRWLADQIKDDSFDKDLDSLVNRFRGNIIVDALEELVEIGWKRIRIGHHIFDVVGPCTRCQMVCINQENGEKTVEPLRTISKLFSGKIRFGIYLTHLGTILGIQDPRLSKNDELQKCLH